jgi:hypothetical protein
MTDTTPTTKQHPKFGTDRLIQCGDPVTQDQRSGVVEVIDTRHQCSIGIRWTDGTFSMEHPKGIAYTPEPPRRAFCVTVPVDLLDRLTTVLNRYADNEGPDEEAFPTLLAAGFILEAAAQKAAGR